MDITRKRLLFRARYMGTNENDIFFGKFAETHLAAMNERQLELFEKLLAVDDPALFQWATGAKQPPPDHDHEIMAMLRNFTLSHDFR